MKSNNDVKLSHTTTIRGIQYTTVSFFNGDIDLHEKIGKMIAESFCASELSDGTTENQLPAEKAG